MKKILLVLFVFFISSYGFSQITNTITERVYPKATFTGMTKSITGVYAKQSVDKDPKTFFIGYDEYKKIYGAGYLEFDLSKIPKDATIDKAELQLTSAFSNPFDQNFNGSIMLHQCPFFSDANQTTWGMLTNAVGGSNTAVINASLVREGIGKRFTSDFLKNVIKGQAGSQLRLSMNKSNTDKIVRINGDQKDLYLEITYTTKSGIEFPDPEPDPNIDVDINGPKTVYVGDEIEFFYNGSGFNDPSYYLYISWIYDKNIFDFVRFTDLDRHEGYSIKLKVKEIGQESLVTKVRTNVLEKFFGEYTDLEGGNISVTVKYKPTKLVIKSNDSFVCSNSLVTYSLEGMASFVKDYTISWQSTPTMTLISGQGTTTATYKSEGNMTGGYETVKAIVTYNGNDYIVENSNVWVGSPGTPRIEGLMIGDYEPGSYYRLMAISPYADSYSWIANGAAQIGPDITVQPLSTGSLKAIKDLPPMEASSIMTLATDYINPPRIAQFTLSVKSWNRCGVSPEFSTNGTIVSRYNYLLKDGNEESIEKTTLSQPPVPITVKVYTFNTGTLVYSEKNVTDFNIQNTTLKDGIYIVVSTDQNGETKSEKVIKTKN